MQLNALCKYCKLLLTAQTLRCMKITAFILMVFGLQVSANTMAQNVTLSEHKAPLEKVLNEIKQQTGYVFFYNQEWLKQAQPVDVDVKNMPLEQALKACFKNQPYSYEIVNKTIVLKLKQPAAEKKETAVPPITVTGKVYDETGQPLPGVTVRQKGTNNATVTDAKGAYSITVADNNSVIAFSFIGYETEELTAKDIANGSMVTLKATATNLKEVVVNKGYYTERRELSTGDVSVVTSKEIEGQPVTDPILALQGRVPGLYIAQTSGVPGSYSSIHIMGLNSIANGNDPFYVVDGVPYGSASLTSINIAPSAAGIPSLQNNNISNVNGRGLSPFNNLNPADIESIEVLKDADATAIYGSRGANGVILITTKKGKAGKTKVDVNVEQGWGEVPRMMNLLNTPQYLQVRHEALKNDGLSANPNRDFDLTLWDTTRYTNWQKVLIGNTAAYTNAQASLSGGTTNTQFNISGGYSNQGTVFPGSYADQKASGHVSINHTSSDQRFHAQFTASYVVDNSNLPGLDFTGVALTLAPDAPALYDQYGNVNWALHSGTPTWNNPIANTFNSTSATTGNLISNLNLGVRILPGLQLSTSFGYNHAHMDQTYLQLDASQPPPTQNLDPNFRQNDISTNDLSSWIIEPQLSYQKKIGRGRLDALLGSTFQESKQNSLGTQFYGFTDDALVPNPGAASGIAFAGDNYTLYRYDALYGRLGYNWQEKYIVNLTVRRDGSSRFGPGKQYGNFGAIGTGWIFSKESFVKNNLPFLSFGKFRASYGVTGNDQIPNYQYLSTYSASGSAYQGVGGLNPTQLTNGYFAWEVVRKLEGGIDLGFFNDRVNVSATYYRNRTGNQLVGEPLPLITGFATVQFNLPAIVQNTGWEITLNSINSKGKDFTWSSSFNLTAPQNELVAFPNIGSTAYKNIYVVGQSLYINKRYHVAGIDPQTGVYFFSSQTPFKPVSPGDFFVTAPVTQKFYGGLQNSLSYKGLQLDFFFQFVKQTAYNYFGTNGYHVGGNNNNAPVEVLSAWQNPGDNSLYGKFNNTHTADPNFKLSASDYGLGDASFIRLKNLSISYQLPEAWKVRMHLDNIKIFLQGENLLTFTKYLGLDPETGSSGLPPLRIVTLGIRAGL